MERIHDKYTMSERKKYAKLAHKMISRKRNPASINSLSKEWGINYSTLYSWIKKYAEVAA